MKKPSKVTAHSPGAAAGLTKGKKRSPPKVISVPDHSSFVRPVVASQSASTDSSERIPAISTSVSLCQAVKVISAPSVSTRRAAPSFTEISIRSPVVDWRSLEKEATRARDCPLGEAESQPIWSLGR